MTKTSQPAGAKTGAAQPLKTSKPSKPPSHPHGDGKISAKKSAGMRTGISRPMRVK